MPTSCSRTAFHWIIPCPETFCLSIANLNSNVIDEPSGKGTLEVVQNPPWPKAIFLFFSAALRLSNSIVSPEEWWCGKAPPRVPPDPSEFCAGRRPELTKCDGPGGGHGSAQARAPRSVGRANSSRVYPKVFSVWAFTTTILPSPSANHNGIGRGFEQASKAGFGWDSVGGSRSVHSLTCRRHYRPAR